MVKKIELISKKVKNINNLNSFRSYLQKKVYSKSGELIGNIYDVLFDRTRILGMLVSGKKKMFIDKEHIGKESENAVVLKIDPVFSLVGKQVFDSAGKKIGMVKGIKRKSNANTYSDLMVKKSIYRRAVPIDKKEIKIAKKNIILRRAHGEE